MKNLSRFFSFAVFLSLFAISSQITAQKKEENDASKKSDQNLIVVKLNVLVLDANGKPVSNIKPEDLKIFEDGVEQKISSIEKKENTKLGIVVDNTGSMRSQLETVIVAAKSLAAIQRNFDEAFVERFVNSEKIEVVQDWTSNKDLLFAKLDSQYVQAGQSAIIDAVYAATKKIKGYSTDSTSRRAIVLISDCEDRDSFYNQKQLLELIKETDIQIFVIGLLDELDGESSLISRKSPKEKSKESALLLSTTSGGTAFFPKNKKELSDSVIAIGTELQSQFVVTYLSSKRSDKKPKLRVEITKGPNGETRTAFTRADITISKN